MDFGLGYCLRYCQIIAGVVSVRDELASKTMTFALTGI